VISVEEAAAHLNVDKWTVYKFLQTGELQAFKAPGTWPLRCEGFDRQMHARMRRRAETPRAERGRSRSSRIRPGGGAETEAPMAVGESHELQFRPRARLVSILGEHLISDHAVGLIELIKNAYDADATEVVLEVRDTVDPAKTTVLIRDNGCGMSVDDIRLRWLSPADDHKEQEKRANQRTRLGRLPIGEKGVGRFAVHQLGRTFEMVTRTPDGPEIAVAIDWDRFDTSDGYLDGVPVRVVERDPEVFTDGQTGTQLRILRPRSPWTDKLLRKVHRTLRRLQCPLAEEEHRFVVKFRCPEFPELESIDPTDILPKAHYEFRALVQGDGKCDLEYECKHPVVESRQESAEGVDLMPIAGEEIHSGGPRCGPFWLNLYVWDRSKDYLQASDVSRRELDAMCGVSLFRDGLRVLPYGEPGDDWLLLDQERIQAPAERIGNNQVIGLVQFDQSSNLQLRDKTNREGLIENDPFLDLRALVRAAIRQFIKYWKNDRPPAREAKTKQKSGDIAGARAVATALHDSAREDITVAIPPDAMPPDGHAAPASVPDSRPQIVSQRRAVELILQHIDGTEDSLRERDNKLDTLLQLAGTGLAAERVVHEFGRHVVSAGEALAVMRRTRGATSLDVALGKIDVALETLRNEFRILAPYEMTGPAPRAKRVRVREIVELALELNRGLLARAEISAGVDGEDWEARLKVTPLLQILDNLVHNACSWVSTSPPGTARRIGIILDRQRARILVADSGPGVEDEVAPHVFEPFFSMKAGGKGLGLYISAELARGLGGRVRLGTTGDVNDLAPWAGGAVFVLELAPQAVPQQGDADG
jgi:signal transduction histidine kinase